MVVHAARCAFQNLFAPETRSVFWKVLGLTLLVLVGLWFAVGGLFNWLALPYVEGLLPETGTFGGVAELVVLVFAGLGLALALALLISPVTAVIASLFLDDIAEVIEARDYPADRTGEAMPFASALVASLGFFGVVIVGNIIAFLLLLLPGINLIAFFVVNGYLLGREFFEFAAMRFRSPAEARAFRAKHASRVFIAGLIIAGFLAIPFLNLLTPLFAASLMVHLHKAISAKDPSFSKDLLR